MQPEQLAQAFERLPEAARTATRERALRLLQSQGLPRRHGEHWKYTDLGALDELGLAGEIETDAPPAELPESADGIEALNVAFALGGVDQRIEDERPEGVSLVAGGRGHRRHRIQVAPNRALKLQMDLEPEAAFQSVVLDLHLEAGARVQLLRCLEASPDARHFTRIRARLDRDASLEIATLDFGGRLSRHDLSVQLEGAGASVQLHGLFHAGTQAHIDNHVCFDHRAPSCSSRQVVRGLAGERSRGIFNGKVVVHPDAQKTDSEQRLANLLLSPRAEINAKPELEIYADDVKCAHGATFGQLDTLALFYLRARGLPEAEARAMLTLAFALEPLKAITDDSFRQQALGATARQLGAKLDGLPS